MAPKTRPRTPPSSSYAHLPQDFFDSNLNDVVRRITPEVDAEAIDGPTTSAVHHHHHASHISILPPEILSEIFIHCLPADRFPVPSCTEAPLLLTHVSQSWRDLALSIPDLWSALHINYKDPSEDIPAAELWLSRSGKRPLSLSLAIDFNEEPQQGILDVLCQHSERWKHVRFDFRHLFCPPMYTLDLAASGIPLLTTFEFHARDMSNTNVSQITKLLSSETATSLREVTWVDDLADTDTLLELPLDKLSRLSLAMEHGTLDYLQLLHRCSNLEQIRITRPLANIVAGAPGGAGSERPRPPIYLPKLTSLNITYDLTGILDHLVLPALRDVRIYTDKHAGPTHHEAHTSPHGMNPYATQSHPHLPSTSAQSSSSQFAPSSTPSSPSGPAWSPAPLLSLIDRSQCSITSFSLSLGPSAPALVSVSEDTVLSCLRPMSASLGKLCIEGVQVGDKFLGGMALPLVAKSTRVGDVIREEREVGMGSWWGGGGSSENIDQQGGLCPNLRELSLDTRITSSQGALAAMVASRLRLSSHSQHPLPIHLPEVDQDADDTRVFLERIRLVDGHKDLESLKEFSLFSLSRARSVKGGQGQGLVVDVIPRKIVKQNTRNFFFRRKLCSSR